MHALTPCAGAGEQVLRLLVELATPRKKRPAPNHAGAASSSSSAPPAPPAAPPSIKLSPDTLLSIFRSSAGMAEYVVRHASRTRVPFSPATALALRLAPLAPALALVLSTPAITGLDAAALARVTRLEFHDATPTRAQLAALAQQLPSLEEVALVRCDLEQAQQPPQQQDPAPAEPPLPPTIRRLLVHSCRLGPQALPDQGDQSGSDQDEGGGGAAFAPVFSLLRSPGKLRHLDMTAPSNQLLKQLRPLRRLKSITIRDTPSGFEPRPLEDLSKLTHVTLHGPLDIDGYLRLPEGTRWQQLTLVACSARRLDDLPLRQTARVVFQDRITLSSSSREHSERAMNTSDWARLERVCKAAGTALRCEPDSAGRFTIHGRLKEALEEAQRDCWHGLGDICCNGERA